MDPEAYAWWPITDDSIRAADCPALAPRTKKQNQELVQELKPRLSETDQAFREKVLKFALRYAKLDDPCYAESVEAKDYTQRGEGDLFRIVERAAKTEYLYAGHCQNFVRVWDDLQNEIEIASEALRAHFGRFTPQIPPLAIRVVVGHGVDTMQGAKQRLAETWTLFPKVWPWQACVLIQRRWRAVIYSPYTSVGAKRLRRAYRECVMQF